jgi:hypothetical protein
MPYLYVVTLVVVTAFAEQSVVYNAVNIKLVKKWITVLCWLASASKGSCVDMPLTRMR